jgi:hypothetical protein
MKGAKKECRARLKKEIRESCIKNDSSAALRRLFSL